ncbi:MAG TPA: SIR2 family protein [Thermoanaerobaculia bacterium]|nr:SIR2 family protein [Thermoanaerobaculia bacterium]
MGAAIAREWADRYEYPLPDRDDLARVSQFVAVLEDPMWPKEEISTFFHGKAPELASEDEPHRILAELPLPIYLTTNYDDFMAQALRAVGKDPVEEFCRWTPRESFRPSVFETARGFEPTVEQPLVFHLHGMLNRPESLVLTEDDYIDFLVNIADTQVIPPRVREALADTMLLFIGYRLADWNFRVLYRGLVEKVDPSGRRQNLMVQLRPADVPSPDAAQTYLERYFDAMSVRVFWGDARAFVQELRKRRNVLAA